MKNKLISALFFFVSFAVSFSVYAYSNSHKDESVTIPLFACLGFGALVAIGADYFKTFAK